MKIFILSDTHDRISKIPSIKNAILVHNPDLIIHLGDIISPFYINLLFNDLRKEKLKD
ncbi:MAG: metallophosphoesterase family protein, partial [Exilispira sp.]